MKNKNTYPPFDNGYFPVSDGHELYFERYGNPKGIPVIYLHGGPGGGFDDKDKRYFDPTKWNVLLFDQRGAGRSKPFASTKNNTTQKLIEDIDALIAKFKIQKPILFGGSWGSTLAMVYAISNPNKIKGMILRGIYLNTDEEQIYMYENARFLRPKIWDRFMSFVPKNKSTLKFYAQKILSGRKEDQKKYAYEWSLYELSIMSLRSNGKKIKKILSKNDLYISLAALEIHYFLHNCFLPKNHILNNIKKIENIETTIVHGNYDLVCPPQSAYKLSLLMKNSKLNMVCAGHSGSDKAIEKALIKALKEY